MLLFLLIVTLCGILYKKVHKGTMLRNEAGMISDASQSQKDEYCVILLIWDRIVKLMMTESTVMTAKSWVGRGGNYCLLGIEFLFYKMKSVMGMDDTDGCTTVVNVFNIIELYT